MGRVQTLLFLAILSALPVVLALSVPDPDGGLEVALDRSVPYIGADIPHMEGYDGEGVLIGIIDTGVDGAHPDLGAGGALVGSYDLFDGGGPADSSGHGTSVAGVIVADGDLRGVAPGAQIISYRVSDDGESVSSDLIIAAIEQAVKDGVDIINISLGVNRTNASIDRAVNEAVEQGITVVAAAGNDGPDSETIGSPGLNSRAITVGATYNNHTSSLVATLKVDGMQFRALPMVGAPQTEGSVVASITFGGYARERDLNETHAGSIVLAERGSDVDGEVVYFSQKERNAADAGAVALLIYNNEPGTYLGELVHEHTDSDYYPKIPTVSLSRQEGQELRELLDSEAELNVFYNPDFVAPFSSRGPVSPFYIKPDLVAPGVFVNTTLGAGDYNLTSGTSFAAPHVSGVAALLLQKNPGLKPDELKSILVTTADPILDEYGDFFGPDSVGSGRINATKALKAGLVIAPPFLTFELSPHGESGVAELELAGIGNSTCRCTIQLYAPEETDMEYTYDGDVVRVSAALVDGQTGRFYGRLTITDGGDVYGVPILVHSMPGTILAREDNGAIAVDILHPEEWTYARISATDSQTGRTYVESAYPDGGRIEVFGNGTYWIDARIDSGGQTIRALGKAVVDSAPTGGSPSADLGVPHRQAAVIAGMIAASVAVGLVLRRR